MPDPRFKDPLVTRFVNNLMMGGKKSVAFSIFYDSMDLIEDRTKESGYETWKKAMTNVTPAVEVKSRRVGGSTFQIPIEIRGDRKISMAIKWLISFSRKRNGKSMSEKLAAEIIAASKGEGSTIRKKEDVHRMADANKAFAHFRV
jgi:small subunit ribosomal protein S7